MTASRALCDFRLLPLWKVHLLCGRVVYFWRTLWLWRQGLWQARRPHLHRCGRTRSACSAPPLVRKTNSPPPWCRPWLWGGWGSPDYRVLRIVYEIHALKQAWGETEMETEPSWNGAGWALLTGCSPAGGTKRRPAIVWKIRFPIAVGKILTRWL